MDAHAFNLPFSQYRFFYQSPEVFAYENNPGFIWRGALGLALREVACTTGQPACDGCPLAGSCAYSILFENHPHPFQSSRYDQNIPKPYILSVWHSGREQDELEVSVILIGRANLYYPYLLQAMKRVGEKGVGRARQPLRLQRVIQALPEGVCQTLYERALDFSGKAHARWDTALTPGFLETPPLPAFIRLDIHTPVRLKSAARGTGSEIRLNQLLVSIVRRAADLASYWHQPMDAVGDRIREAKAVTALDQKRHWQAQSRFSSRQKQKILMGGVLGQFYLELSAQPLLWSWLWAGQWLHVGKGAVMGSGRYSLQGAEDFRSLLTSEGEL